MCLCLCISLHEARLNKTGIFGEARLNKTGRVIEARLNKTGTNVEARLNNTGMMKTTRAEENANIPGTTEPNCLSTPMEKQLSPGDNRWAKGSRVLVR